MLGFLAGFTGDDIARRLQAVGVTADFIHVAGGMSCINVKINADGVETEVDGMGPAITATDVEALYQRLDALKAGTPLSFPVACRVSFPVMSMSAAAGFMAGFMESDGCYEQAFAWASARGLRARSPWSSLRGLQWRGFWSICRNKNSSCEWFFPDRPSSRNISKP